MCDLVHFIDEWTAVQFELMLNRHEMSLVTGILYSLLLALRVKQSRLPVIKFLRSILLGFCTEINIFL